MGKHIPFGPGHPDFDNQLDLFDLEPEDASSQPDTSDGAEVPSVVNLPCPWCCGYVGLATVQDAVMQPEPPRAVTGNAGPACLLCQDSASVPVRLQRAAGKWWDDANQRVVSAESLDLARRKVAGGEPLPLYVEHGGYAPGDA